MKVFVKIVVNLLLCHLCPDPTARVKRAVSWGSQEQEYRSSSNGRRGPGSDGSWWKHGGCCGKRCSRWWVYTLRNNARAEGDVSSRSWSFSVLFCNVVISVTNERFQSPSLRATFLGQNVGVPCVDLQLGYLCMYSLHYSISISVWFTTFFFKTDTKNKSLNRGNQIRNCQKSMRNVWCRISLWS